VWILAPWGPQQYHAFLRHASTLSLHAEIAISVRHSYICAEIALLVLNLSDIIFLQTAPHTQDEQQKSHDANHDQGKPRALTAT